MPSSASRTTASGSLMSFFTALPPPLGEAGNVSHVTCDLSDPFDAVADDRQVAREATLALLVFTQHLMHEQHVDLGRAGAARALLVLPERAHLVHDLAPERTSPISPSRERVPSGKISRFQRSWISLSTWSRAPLPRPPPVRAIGTVLNSSATALAFQRLL